MAFSGLAFLLVLLAVFVIAEVAMRVAAKPRPPFDNKQKDDVLGWRSKEGYRYQTNHFPDNKWGIYPVKLSFTKYGFRKWDTGLQDTTKPAAFFIGDSYTESLHASDNETFYSIVGDSLPLRVFAYGSEGYGTTQELLILKQYIDSINPKYVILEMCANDFPDNYWELEKRTGYRVGERRPYLTLDNKLEYHHPLYWVDGIKQYSHVAYFLTLNIKRALVNLKLLPKHPLGEDIMFTEGLRYKEYFTSYQLTGNGLKNIRQLLDARGIKLLVFNADNFEPTQTDLKRLCKENGIDMIDSVAQQVLKHQRAGETVRAFDGYHWNPNGHRIVASQIIKYFRNNRLTF